MIKYAATILVGFLLFGLPLLCIIVPIISLIKKKGTITISIIMGLLLIIATILIYTFGSPPGDEGDYGDSAFVMFSTLPSYILLWITTLICSIIDKIKSKRNAKNIIISIIFMLPLSIILYWVIIDIIRMF